MRSPRIAIIFDDSVRPDTTGFYCRRALACLVDTVHIRPDQLGHVSASDFDLFVRIDDGLRYQLPPAMHPCVWWAIDTHLDVDWYQQQASNVDVVFAAQRDGALDLSKSLGRTIHWLPLGCDPSFHRRHDIPKKWNVSFVGNLFPGPRSDLIQLLQERVEDVHVERQFFDEMARVYSGSRIVFNRSIRNDVNMRVFEAAATGSMLLTNDLTDNGLAELFEYGKHIEVYDCAEELLDKVKFYLSQEHARERIARLGRLHALERHTYRHRMQQMLETVKRELSFSHPTRADRGTNLSFRPYAPPADITSIVVLTYNQIEFTRQCLDSIRSNTFEPFELIVIDNASTDGTVEYLEDCPDVVLVCNRENLGFPTAANQGMRLARGRWVLLLNNDTIVPPGWLGKLLKPLIENESIGLVGPSSNAVSGPQQIEVDYKSIEQMEKFTERLATQNSGVLEDTERLVGFCFLISRSVIDKIGLLDERFGIGCFEDDDYTLRARLAGFRTVIVRDAFVHHFCSQTFRSSGIDMQALLQQNREKFASKWSQSPAETPEAVADGRRPASESQLRLLLLAHVDFLKSRLDRSQYLRYLALAKKYNVVLFGPGIAGYRRGMSIGEAIETACGGKRPEWVLHGLDPRASGIPLVSGLRDCGIPTAYEFGDSWTMRELQASFINEQRFHIAFILATCDLSFYRAACRDTEFCFLPNAVDTSIFRDYGEPKQYDVLVYGTPHVCPLSSRIDAALDQQHKLRVRQIVHPDDYLHGCSNNEQVIVGERLSREIGRAWISIATQGVYDVLLMKHLEIAASGTAVAGDMARDGRPFFGRDYIDLSTCRSSTDIVDRLSTALDEKDDLVAMSHRCRQRVVEELSSDRYATRLLEILADFQHSTVNWAPRAVAPKTKPASGLFRIREQFAWPEKSPKLGDKQFPEGWLGDGSREALEESCDDGTSLVVELGSWLGLSTRFIADCAPNAHVFAIDHFNGSTEHRADPSIAPLLPDLYDEFLARCWSYRSRVTPVRATTLDGMRLLADTGIHPDVIYVDASHDYESVTADIRTAWSLFPSAVLVGDDYADDSVRRAVDKFAKQHDSGVEVIGRSWPAWRLRPKRAQAHGNRRVDIALDSSALLSTPSHEITQSRISLCMIVRDNENTIEPCLASIKPWVDEMIVVDTGSKDRTPEVARKHGAQVHYFPWPDSFALARNESLRHATGDWIFWMDSDDTITAENGRKLRELIVRPVPENLFGYIMQVHCPNDSDDSDQDVTVVDHIKLFRNRSDLRFEGRIHEQIMPAIRRAGGEVEWTDIFVVHSGSDNTEEGRRRKQERDLRLLQMEAEDCPNQSFVLFNIGMTYADMGDHANAVTALERSIAVSEPAESHLRKAYALLAGSLSALEQFQKADEVCRTGRDRFPLDVELLFREGLVSHHLEQLERSVEAYLQALRVTEDRHFSSVDRGLNGYKTRHNLAVVFEELGRLREAEEQWRLVVSEVPTYRQGWRGLTANLIQQKKYDAVERQIVQMSHHPRLAIDVCHIRTDLAQAVGDLPKAARELEAGLASHPGDKSLLERVCQLLFEFGSPEQAEIRLRELLSLDQSNPAAWHNLGATYLRLNRHQPAADAFRTAIRLRPDSALSYLYLGFALEELRDRTGAKAAWLRASQMSPDDPAAQESRNRLQQLEMSTYA